MIHCKIWAVKTRAGKNFSFAKTIAIFVLVAGVFYYILFFFVVGFTTHRKKFESSKPQQKCFASLLMILNSLKSTQIVKFKYFGVYFFWVIKIESVHIDIHRFLILCQMYIMNQRRFLVIISISLTHFISKFLTM